MTPTIGTVLNMTPAAGRVSFLADGDDGEEWTLALVGWAVVVTYVSDDGTEYETGLDAVVIAEDRYPVPLSAHVRELVGRVMYWVEPSPPGGVS